MKPSQKALSVMLTLLSLAGCSETPATGSDVQIHSDTLSQSDSEEGVAETWLSPLIGESLCVAGVPRRGALQESAPQHLSELGVKKVRMDILWHKVEKEKGAFDFSSQDSALRPYLDAGFDVLGLLCYGTPWASSATDDDHHFPPDDPEDFANFVKKTIEYFGEEIRNYEIWNEPNAGFRFWKPDLNGDAVAYGALLKAAVTRGRESCPECLFLFGGPFFHSQIVDGHIPFLNKAQEAHPELSDAYDVMAFHPYPLYPPQAAPEAPTPENEWTFSEMVHGIKETMSAQQADAKPLWATEFGWPIFGEVDEEKQAAFLIRGLLQLLSLGTETVCWYDLYEGENPKAFPPEQSFGLLTYGDPEAELPPARKPAFFALSQMGNRFRDFRIAKRLEEEITLPPRTHGYVLKNAEKERWWVLWTHAADSEVEIQLPALPLESRSLTGEELIWKDTTVPLSESPLFLKMPSG